MNGGKLCNFANDPKDIYTLSDDLAPGVMIDKNDPNILIKRIRTKGEYTLSKKLASFGVSPKIYGFFECNDEKIFPKYSVQQDQIKGRKYFDPNNTEEVGEPIGYTKQITNNKYMVMERIHGTSLHTDDVEQDEINIKNNMDEIYRIYNIFCDNGIILRDLFPRNIMLGNDNKIYMIDFEPAMTTQQLYAIPISERLSKEKLLQILLKSIGVIHTKVKQKITPKKITPKKITPKKITPRLTRKNTKSLNDKKSAKSAKSRYLTKIQKLGILQAKSLP